MRRRNYILISLAVFIVVYITLDLRGYLEFDSIFQHTKSNNAQTEESFKYSTSLESYNTEDGKKNGDEVKNILRLIKDSDVKATVTLVGKTVIYDRKNYYVENGVNDTIKYNNRLLFDVAFEKDDKNHVLSIEINQIKQ